MESQPSAIDRKKGQKSPLTINALLIVLQPSNALISGGAIQLSEQPHTSSVITQKGLVNAANRIIQAILSIL